MARYIDANEALRMMQNSKQDNPCESEHKGIWNTAHECCMSCVDSAPTEDVVPRSEVERLNEKIGLLKRDRYRLFPDGRIELLPRTDLDRIKAEVARDIFEEIESAAMSKIDVNAPISTLDDILYIQAIDEVRQKYSEGEK